MQRHTATQLKMSVFICPQKKKIYILPHFGLRGHEPQKLTMGFCSSLKDEAKYIIILGGQHVPKFPTKNLQGVPLGTFKFDLILTPQYYYIF